MALGQLRGPILGDVHTSGLPQFLDIVASGEMDVCEGNHSSVVMKKVKDLPNPRL